MMKEKPYPLLKSKMFLLLVISLFMSIPAFSQQTRTVTGVVKSQGDQESIPGVSVLVKGTQRGTVTDLDGIFSLEASDGEVLVISLVGYETKEVSIKEGVSKLDIILNPSLSDLNEVVVIGYGSQRKSDLTGAVSTVKGDVLQERPAASLNQALAGRLTGVNVSVNSGRPGGRSNIRIRGNTSVSVSNNPLYVIDGVIL